MKIILAIMMFFIISALFIISNNNLAMYKQKNIVNFVDMYTKWLNQIFSNTQEITGEVVEMNWLPQKFYDVGVE